MKFCFIDDWDTLNTMAADDLATQEARASAVMVINKSAQNILVSAPEGLAIYMAKQSITNLKLKSHQNF